MTSPLDDAGCDAGDPTGFDPEAVLARDPRVLLDPAFLHALRTELFASLTPEQAGTVLLRMGFLLGLRDAARALAGADGGGGAPCQPPLAMRCHAVPAGAAIEVHGSWPDARESAARLRAGGAAAHGACDLSAGYTSGWLSGMFEADLLAVESQCRSEGHTHCAFRAREAAVWQAEGGAAAGRAAAVPFAEYRARVRSREARHVLARLDDEAPTGIDRRSACVHIWGPVMVLPFSGAEEGLRALDLIGRDPQARAVSVVVVDLAEAIVDEAFGALALEQIVRTATSWGAETLFAEPSQLSERAIAELEHPPLLVFKDLEQAIASAFQIARAQRRLL